MYAVSIYKRLICLLLILHVIIRLRVMPIFSCHQSSFVISNVVSKIIITTTKLILVLYM